MDSILKQFLDNPQREIHIRELARKLKISPTTVSKILKNYEKKSILSSEKKLNHIIFRANIESKRFRIEKIYYNLTKMLDSKLLDYLENSFNNPEAIGIFGSFAKGEDTPKSDVDIFIISPNKKSLKFDEFEKKIGRKIHLFILSRKEVDLMKENNKELLNNMINGIILSGQWEVLR